MRIGKINKLLDNVESITSTTGSENGFEISRILDPNTKKKWQSTISNEVINITLIEPMTIEIVNLFNVGICGKVIVKTKLLDGTEIESITKENSDLHGLESQNLLFDFTESQTTEFELLQIILVCDPPTDISYEQGHLAGAHLYMSTLYGVTDYIEFESTVFMGYLWAGDCQDYKELEAISPLDNITDETTITRENVPSTLENYDFQEYNVTTNKSDFTFNELRSMIRYLIDDGLWKPRPFIFEAECIFTKVESLYGIFNDTRIGYDILEIKKENSDEFTCQISTKIREVS
jgi:hypothetical protein